MSKKKIIDTIESAGHTLIITSVSDSFAPIEAIVNNPNDKYDDTKVEEIYKRIPGYVRYDLYIGNFDASITPGSQFHTLIYALQQADENSAIIIHINSDGGLFSELLQIEQSIMHAGIPIATVLEPAGYSAGALLWLCGYERIVSPYSTLMVHTAQSDVSGTMSNNINSIMHSKNNVLTYIENRVSSFLTKEEMTRMFSGEDLYFDTIELCKRGIATSVSTADGLLSASEWLETLKIAKAETKTSGKKAKSKKGS